MNFLHIQTPLPVHRALAATLGKRVSLKMESSQPSGSFKLRGIGALAQQLVAQGATHLVCPSGGNAGFAAAYAGAALGATTTVVVPHTTAESVRQAIRAIGADVVEHGADWVESNVYALQLASAPQAAYVPAFDHPAIWRGNATLIDEAVAQSAHPFDVVICAVGGGGLLCGVLEGLHRNGLADVPVIAVETEGAASFKAAVDAGALVTLPSVNTLAGSLAARRVAQAALDWTRRHTIHNAIVSDAQAVAACLRFADDQRTLVEPACGAALAVAYENHPLLASFHHPLLIVCGGIGVDLAKLAAWKTQCKL